MEEGNRKFGEVDALVHEGVWLDCIGEAYVVACRRGRKVAVITSEEGLVRTREDRTKGENGGRTYSQLPAGIRGAGALSAELASERKRPNWGMRSGLIMVLEEYLDWLLGRRR